ncbi:PQ loop repeat [Novymonas esmeraldas]|uniref:Mannose-P-dolichol utilization defect 1 protein homolog n=1 Tax=Novymonas esmeraldas TaxID=1808958 RepID=A0AAW0F9E9_9TRYP
MSVESTLRYVISNGLAYAVVVGASMFKVPQILKVWQTNKADGISLLSIFVELFSCVISTGWGVVQGLPFRDCGENYFITLQLVVLLLLVAKLQKKSRGASLALVTQIVALWAFAGGYVPRPIHTSLMSGQVLLNMSSRIPQIYENHRTRCRGQLSFLTFFIGFGGAVARTLTTALNVSWEQGKAVMLVQMGVAATLNAIILSQMLYYGAVDKAPAEKQRDARKKHAVKNE